MQLSHSEESRVEFIATVLCASDRGLKVTRSSAGGNRCHHAERAGGPGALCRAGLAAPCCRGIHGDHPLLLRAGERSRAAPRVGGSAGACRRNPDHESSGCCNWRGTPVKSLRPIVDMSASPPSKPDLTSRPSGLSVGDVVLRPTPCTFRGSGRRGGGSHRLAETPLSLETHPRRGRTATKVPALAIRVVYEPTNQVG